MILLPRQKYDIMIDKISEGSSEDSDSKSIMENHDSTTSQTAENNINQNPTDTNLQYGGGSVEKQHNDSMETINKIEKGEKLIHSSDENINDTYNAIKMTPSGFANIQGKRKRGNTRVAKNKKRWLSFQYM